MGKQTENIIFNMSDYRSYVKVWAEAKGRGAFRNIAIALNIHTTLISQISNGKKSFTEEQASRICDHMGLSALETDCFLKLVQIERAGTTQLRAIYQRQLKDIKTQATEIKNRVPESKKLSIEDRAIFYSSWHYSFIRLLTSIEEYQTSNSIAKYLNINLSRVEDILIFLVSRNLCKLSKGKFIRTEMNTHVEAASPLAVRHHQNWRVKSIDMLEQLKSDDLIFTAPVSISEDDIPKIREILLKSISDIAKVVQDSPSEKVAYLGIDWIKM